MPTKAKPRPVISHQGPTHQTFYSNNVGLQMTPWDIKLLFGRIVKADEQALEIEESCAIYLTPEHAAALLRALGENIQRYVKDYGPLRRLEGPSNEASERGAPSKR